MEEEWKIPITINNGREIHDRLKGKKKINWNDIKNICSVGKGQGTDAQPDIVVACRIPWHCNQKNIFIGTRQLKWVNYNNEWLSITFVFLSVYILGYWERWNDTSVLRSVYGPYLRSMVHSVRFLYLWNSWIY